MGLVLEVAATLWALGQAMALGVLHEANCGKLTAAAYLNDLFPRECRRVRVQESYQCLRPLGVVDGFRQLHPRCKLHAVQHARGSAHDRQDALLRLLVVGHAVCR